MRTANINSQNTVIVIDVQVVIVWRVIIFLKEMKEKRAAAEDIELVVKNDALQYSKKKRITNRTKQNIKKQTYNNNKKRKWKKKNKKQEKQELVVQEQRNWVTTTTTWN